MNKAQEKLMKITVKERPRMTLEEFADRHGLEMIVTERSPSRLAGVARYYANFSSVEIKDGSILSGAIGNGETPAEAIAAYAHEISEELIVVNARTADRREILTPALTYEKKQGPPRGRAEDGR
jgi:DNA-binding transcriptional regulator LsrR (DeoR family)